MTQASLSLRQRMEYKLGFRVMAIPFILLLGLIAILGTTPSLVAHQVGRLHSPTTWEGAVKENLVGLLTEWNSLYYSVQVAEINRDILPSALCLSLGLVAASIIRSFKAHTLRPTLATTAGLLVGFFLLPVALWTWSLVALTWHVLKSFEHALTNFLHHLPKALMVVGAVLFLIVLVAMIVWGAVILFGIASESSPRFLALSGIAIVVAAGLLYILGPYIATIFAWLAAVFVFVAVAFVVAGVLVAALGQAGRTAYLSVKASGLAGSNQAKCIDLSIGVGLTVSLIILGAVCDGPFGFERMFRDSWVHNPVLGHLPMPIHLYREIMPVSGTDIIAPAFQNYNPFLDAVLLTLTAGIGTLSLLFSGGRWSRSGESIIWLPIMISAGVALAATLPLLILWAQLQEHDSS
jgi:hypothetical protein